MSGRGLSRIFRSPCLRILASITALALAGVLGVVGNAWACVPQARMVMLSPMASGPAGARITVEGVGFDAPPNHIDVRWNTATGPQLGEASGPTFSLDVTIPPAGPGLYRIIVLSRGPDGNIGNTGAASFQVTDGAGAGSPSPPSVPANSPELERDGVSSAPVVFGLALGGGLGLVLLGAISGSFLARRRLRVEVSGDKQ